MNVMGDNNNLSLTKDEIDSIISYIESCTFWNTDTPTIDDPDVKHLLEKLNKMMEQA